jgi:hypothetical protein
MSNESAAAATKSTTAVGLFDQLRMSVSNGAVLDLKGARLAADLIRDALHGKLGVVPRVVGDTLGLRLRA